MYSVFSAMKETQCMKCNRAKGMLACELHSFNYSEKRQRLYMSNKYIRVETETSVSEEAFG